MRTHGHEDGHIPQAEIERRRVDAVVHREYLDPGYMLPNTAPLVAHDVIEPRWDQRMPGPGHYLLFLVNAAGVPSEAAFVRIG